MSPLASFRACLQSIIGAPVFSRSSFTCAAEIFTVVVPIAKSSLYTNLDPRQTTRAGPDFLHILSRLDVRDGNLTQPNDEPEPMCKLERLVLDFRNVSNFL